MQLICAHAVNQRLMKPSKERRRHGIHIYQKMENFQRFRSNIRKFYGLGVDSSLLLFRFQNLPRILKDSLLAIFLSLLRVIMPRGSWFIQHFNFKFEFLLFQRQFDKGESYGINFIIYDIHQVINQPTLKTLTGIFSILNNPKLRLFSTR